MSCRVEIPALPKMCLQGGMPSRMGPLRVRGGAHGIPWCLGGGPGPIMHGGAEVAYSLRHRADAVAQPAPRPARSCACPPAGRGPPWPPGVPAALRLAPAGRDRGIGHIRSTGLKSGAWSFRGACNRVCPAVTANEGHGLREAAPPTERRQGGRQVACGGGSSEDRRLAVGRRAAIGHCSNAKHPMHAAQRAQRWGRGRSAQCTRAGQPLARHPRPLVPAITCVAAPLSGGAVGRRQLQGCECNQQQPCKLRHAGCLARRGPLQVANR